MTYVLLVVILFVDSNYLPADEATVLMKSLQVNLIFVFGENNFSYSNSDIKKLRYIYSYLENEGTRQYILNG